MPTRTAPMKSSPSSHQSSPRFTTICQRYQSLHSIIKKSTQSDASQSKEPSLLKSCLILFLQHRKRPRSLYTTINDTDRMLYLDEMPGKAVSRENVGLGLFILQKGKKTVIPPVRIENKVWRELSLLGIDVKLYLGIKDNDRMDDFGSKLRRLRREVREVCEGLPSASEYEGNAFERMHQEKSSIARRVEQRSETPKGKRNSTARSRTSLSGRNDDSMQDYLNASLGSITSRDDDLSPLGRDNDPLFSRSTRNAQKMRRARSPLVLMRDKNASSTDMDFNSTIDSPLSRLTSSSRDATLAIDNLIQRRATSPLVRIMQEAFIEEANHHLAHADERRSSLSPQNRRYAKQSPFRERIKTKRQRKVKQRFHQLAEEYRVLSEKFEREKTLQKKIQEWKSKSPTNGSREKLRIRFPHHHENIHEMPLSAMSHNGSETWVSPDTPPAHSKVMGRAANEFISVPRIEVNQHNSNGVETLQQHSNGGVPASQRANVANWTPKQVAAYITKLDASFAENGVAQSFVENAIDGTCLRDLNHDLLRELGVEKVGHRIKILRGLESLLG